MRLRLYSIIIAVLLFASCANRGVGPQGGPKDSIPPVALQAEPELGVLNFHGKRIEITFNEYIQLDNLAANLLMSPPQQNPPDVTARGKKLMVLFQDTLRDSTTYTIDFGSAVCDFTEKNPLHGFTFYFSTGDEIDTLETIGRVFDAENLNPLQGIFVGIHQDKADSAFTTQPFLRIARTDSAGCYRIGNMHAGEYRLYAVDDVSRDNRLTPGEALAFADEYIRPAVYTAHHNDTVDSLHEQPDLPISTLFLFKEKQQKLYLQRTLRDEQHRITLLFSSAPDSAVQLRVINDTVPLNYHTHFSAHLDTVTLWLLDSASIMQDSLFLEARYRRTDSLFRLEWYTDTLRAIWRAPKLTAKAKEAKEREARNRRLTLKTNARKDFDINDTLRLSCTTPLAVIPQDSFHLLQKKDTAWLPIPFTIAPYDTLPMSLTLYADLKPEGQYELRIDSGALQDVYGITHVAAKYPLTVKALEDYSTLRVKILPFDPQARIQVLSEKDEVLRELPAAPEGAFFQFLKPQSYYLRLYMDANGDGQWTTGEWSTKRQPEAVYYFPEKIQTKSNWDFEQEWNYNAVPQTQAKPNELIKASASKKKK